MTWFWSTPSWQEYSDAYGGGHAGNDSDNLIVPIADELTMWRRLTKGHRADVRRAERNGLSVEILYGGNYPEMDSFRLLHAKDAGRVTRSLETWRIQQRWIEDGHAALVLAKSNGLVAGALFITYEGRAYYASAARDPDRPNEGGAHLILWKFMCWLARNGYTELDMGPAPDPADTKAVSIAQFKRHFGAA